MHVTLDGKGLIYEQIARSLKAAILEGELTSGKRLPSTRLLSQALDVSRKSVIEAYELLCAEHLVVAHAGSGTRVTDLDIPLKTKKGKPKTISPSRFATRMRALPPSKLAGSRSGPRPPFNLQYGEPLISAALFHSWRRKLSAAALRVTPQYQAAAGYLPLRRAIAEHLSRRRGVHCDSANIVIVSGTQQALTLVARLVLDEGDTAVVEEPSYELAMHCLLAHGARLVSVETDEQGLVVPKLPLDRAKLVYVTPSHQFPSGVVMSQSRRRALIDWASRVGAWIFEDNYDAEFYAAKKTDPVIWSLDVSERTFYVGSFSKTLFPSLRLGYIICPEGLREDLVMAKLLDDLGSPAIEQAALAAFIHSRQYDKHLKTSIDELVRRREILVTELRKLATEIEIGPHQGGMHFIIWFRSMSFDHVNALITRAATAGLGIYPVHDFYKTKPARPGLLVGYAGLSCTQLKTAVQLLADCIYVVQKP